jgi:Phytanoyl-CoA dioxygenase (PhyH)
VDAGAILVDPERNRDLHRHGFTVMPLLDQAEVEGALAALEAIHTEFGRRTGDDAQKFRVSYYDTDMDYQRAVARVVRDLMEPRISRVANGYKVAAGGEFSKAPGAGEMGVHSDFTATADPHEVTFTIWCALADADETNGTLCMLPGSHKVSGQIIGPGVTPFFSKYEKEIRARSVPVRVKAGEALIFRTGMIHWSGANRSGRPRPAMHCLGIPESSRHAIYLLNCDAGGDRFDVRDMSATTVFDPSQPLPLLGSRRNENRPVPWPELERVISQLG